LNEGFIRTSLRKSAHLIIQKKLFLNVLKVQNPYASASIIADSLIEQLEQGNHLEQLLKNL
jgi:ribosomal protein S3